MMVFACACHGPFLPVFIASQTCLDSSSTTIAVQMTIAVPPFKGLKFCAIQNTGRITVFGFAMPSSKNGHAMAGCTLADKTRSLNRIVVPEEGEQVESSAGL